MRSLSRGKWRRRAGRGGRCDWVSNGELTDGHTTLPVAGRLGPGGRGAASLVGRLLWVPAVPAQRRHHCRDYCDSREGGLQMVGLSPWRLRAVYREISRGQENLPIAGVCSSGTPGNRRHPATWPPDWRGRIYQLPWTHSGLFGSMTCHKTCLHQTGADCQVETTGRDKARGQGLLALAPRLPHRRPVHWLTQGTLTDGRLRY